MNRVLGLKIVLGVMGVLFVALCVPMVSFVRQQPALSMMLSVYVTLGVFLLLAIPEPAQHRSLIAFTAWSSFAHAALMGTQAMRGMIAHSEMIGVWMLLLFGVLLLALAPSRRPVAVAPAQSA